MSTVPGLRFSFQLTAQGLSSKLDDPDFVFDNTCLQQYNCYVAPARKLPQHGRRSGGMICFAEQSISKYFEQLNVTLENTIVFKISKLLFGSSEDILFISTYIPPMGSRFYDHKDISGGIVLLERAILDLIVSHEDCSVILCGDLNARTGVKNTFFGADIMDVTTVILDESRQSQDNVINSFGRSLLSLCSGLDFGILNGCTPGNSDKYTYISVHGNSLVDYFIVSKEPR